MKFIEYAGTGPELHINISIDVYMAMLNASYPTMPEDIRWEYVKEYILMEGPGFPTITKEHIELYGK